MSEKEKQETRGTSRGPGGGGPGHGDTHEHREGAPEWLISFADNVTLMMGFFVILLAFNMKPANKGTGGGTGEGPTGGVPADLVDFSVAVRSAFNNPVDLSSVDPIDLPLIRRILERRGESKANHGLEWRQIRIVACGDADPLVGNAYNEERHRPNQRVEVITTDRVVRD